MSDEPAFPRLKRLDAEYGGFNRLDYAAVNDGGLTKREYAAIMAMQGLLAGGWRGRAGHSYKESNDALAESAREKADALLAALKEKP